MSSHWTDTRNQSNVGLIRAEMHIKMNIMFDYIQFYHYIKEGCPTVCRKFREVLLEKKQRVKISYYTLVPKGTFHCNFLLNIGNR